MSQLNGAQIFIESLKKEGVEVVFGYPGATIIDVQHHLHNSGIRYILVRHEQAAVHAADGYARVSGKPGVVLVTGGPGATNTVTGIAGANMDSIPIVIFTGQVPRLMIGNDAFQEVDIVGVTRPITKHNYLLKDVNKMASTIKEAFYVATSGRPGPVLVDMPKDVLQGLANFKYPEKVFLPAYQPHTEPHSLQVNKVVDLLLKAKRPLIYSGGGIILSQAEKELLELVETLNIPVTSTLMGLGGFPGTHPLSLGMLGMHGLYQANMAISKADLVLAIGARFDDRVTGRLDAFCPCAKIVHIDIDPSSIHKTVTVDLPIVADAKKALRAILKVLKTRLTDNETFSRSQWLNEINFWRQENPLNNQQSNNLKTIKPQFVIEELYRLTKGEAIICTDVGQHQMWTAQFYKFDHPRKLITSGGFGVMGFGLPAAIGCQIADPEALVVNVAGDGSILMNIQEFVTAVEEELPIKVAIINNGCLGMVRQWQQLFYDKCYAGTILKKQPDFVKLADAFGCSGFRAKNPQDVPKIIEQALAVPGPAIMEFIVEPEECVYPMVPAGSSLEGMLTRPPHLA